MGNVRALIFTLPILLAPAYGSGCSSSDDAGPWDGHTYLLNIPSANWTEPSGFGPDIGMFVPQFLFAVKGNKVTIGTAMAGVQDMCNPTAEVDLTGAAPKSKMVAASFPLHIVDKMQTPAVVVDTTTHNFTFTSVLPGGESGAGEVTVTIDAAELYPLFRLIPMATKEKVCSALKSGGAPCVKCPHNDQEFCLNLKAEGLNGELKSTTLKNISPSDVPASCKNP